MIKRNYLLWSLLLFAAEVVIALFFHDDFIRPIFGDYLVVILLYCLVRSFTSFSIRTTALGVWIFSFVVEFLQWVNILKILGIPRSLFTDLILGSHFYWGDLVAYTLGIATVLALEKRALLKSPHS